MKHDTRFKASMGFRLNRSTEEEVRMLEVEPGEVVELTTEEAREFQAHGRGQIVGPRTPLGKARDAT